MKSIVKYILISILLISVSQSQNQHTIMSYNLLNYPGTDVATRNQYFRTTIASVAPDILVVQEMNSQAGVDGFLINVLNYVLSGYSAGTFIDGPDTDNAIFFKTAAFTFIANHPIPTALRNISEFVLRENSTGDTLRIYSVHLKASTGSSNEQQRLSEATILRNVTNALPPNSDFFVCGDFNLYGSTESAYSKLLNQSTSGYFIDIINMPGTWNNSNYAAFHTQSPRVRAFGGGSTGGMDDRFDLFLMSHSLINPGGITYIPGSFKAFGNDGNHYNDSINKPPNTAVSQLIANALHNASDHLPIFASFTFSSDFVELTSFTALVEGLYNGNTMIPDTVIIELRNAAFPYAIVDQTKIYLNNSGQGTGKFNTAINGTPYYLVLKHRNAMETWSASTQTFLNGAMTYDFTTSSNKAFGNNLKLIGSKYCLYSGDLNQDGVINVSDLNLVFTDNVNGVNGYVASDVNGDGYTESEDLTKVFINHILGIVRKKPL